MKKSNGIVKLVLFIVVVGTLGGFGYYYFFLRDTDQAGGIFPSLSGEKVTDYKNGIYVVKNNTTGAKISLKNCYVDSINDYLVVINEDYYLYHGNCLNMVYVSQGKTENLKFEKENDSKYYIKLNDKVYKKDNSVNKIEVFNNVISDELKVNYKNLKNIIDYSEFPGHYYSFIGVIPTRKGHSFSYTYNPDSNSFTFEIFNGDAHYTKNMQIFNDIPKFYISNSNIIIIDKNKIGEGYKSELYVYSDMSKTYDYLSIFPININGIVIDSNWYRLFRIDEETKSAYVLFSRTSDICDFSNNNMYYEFRLPYDFQTTGFKTPDLYKKGSTPKDCSYAKKYYLTEG